MKKSAGILVYRMVDNECEVFLVHPGGPFWKNKDDGAWSVPKGEFSDDEDPLMAARREFREETGQEISGDFQPLPIIRQKGGKQVQVWTVKGEVDAAAILSNTFSMEWPPHSGRKMNVPEVDKAAWFDLKTARKKILASQLPLLNSLEALLV